MAFGGWRVRPHPVKFVAIDGIFDGIEIANDRRTCAASLERRAKARTSPALKSPRTLIGIDIANFLKCAMLNHDIASRDRPDEANSSGLAINLADSRQENIGRIMTARQGDRRPAEGATDLFHRFGMAQGGLDAKALWDRRFNDLLS